MRLLFNVCAFEGGRQLELGENYWRTRWPSTSWQVQNYETNFLCRSRSEFAWSEQEDLWCGSETVKQTFAILHFVPTNWPQIPETQTTTVHLRTHGRLPTSASVSKKLNLKSIKGVIVFLLSVYLEQRALQTQLFIMEPSFYKVERKLKKFYTPQTWSEKCIVLAISLADNTVALIYIESQWKIAGVIRTNQSYCQPLSTFCLKFNPQTRSDRSRRQQRESTPQLRPPSPRCNQVAMENLRAIHARLYLVITGTAVCLWMPSALPSQRCERAVPKQCAWLSGSSLWWSMFSYERVIKFAQSTLKFSGWYRHVLPKLPKNQVSLFRWKAWKKIPWVCFIFRRRFVILTVFIT